jgi:hypothetical protein
MTEAQWLSAALPDVLLHYLAANPGLVSERKLRLFGVACLRRLFPLLTHEVSRSALDVAERYANGQATHDEAARVTRDILVRQATDPTTSSLDTFLGDSICQICKAALRGTDLESAISYASSLACFADRRRAPRSSPSLRRACCARSSATRSVHRTSSRPG